MCSEEFNVDRLARAHVPDTSESSKRKIPVGNEENSLSQRRARMLASKEDSLRFVNKNHTTNPSESRTSTLNASFRLKAEDEAKAVTEERFERSELGGKIKEIPRFHTGEILLGKRLGKGGFSNVDEVRAILIGNNSRIMSPILAFPSRLTKLGRSDTVAVNNRESRKFIAEHCHRRSGDARYAIKMLRKDILQNEDRIILGLCDLAIETRFLANLEHPNIIKLRAISSANPFSGDYFLILDRLYDTLSKRIEVWKVKYRKLYSVLGRLRDRSGTKRLNFYESRIEKAFDLSAAIEYCHAFNIVHRDIKPENIGFDVRGDIKIFDFG